MKPAAVLAIAFIVTAVAGCSESAPSTPAGAESQLEDAPAIQALTRAAPERYLNATVIDLEFQASDGTTIRGAAYMPSEPRPGFSQERRFGTVVQVADFYSAEGDGAPNGRLKVINADHPLNRTGIFGLLVSHGFVYVASSAPGTGASGGCFDFGSPRERKAIAEYVEWVAEQPWSNGNVGMSGGNYAGTAQWMAAIQRPPHLKTIVPHVAFNDPYKYLFHDGVPYQFAPTYSLDYELTYGYGINKDDLQNAEPNLAAARRLCPDLASHVAATGTTFAKGVYDDFWKERDLSAGMEEIQASVFLVHGLKDTYQRPTHALVWDRLHVEKAFWLQQTNGGGVPYFNPLNATDVRPDYRQVLVAWYDHYLNGVENGIPHALPPVQVQDDSRHWRNESRWPPVTQPRVLHLAQGALLPDSDGGSTVLAGVPTGASIPVFDAAAERHAVNDPPGTLPDEAGPVVDAAWPVVAPYWATAMPYWQEASSKVPPSSMVDDPDMPDSVVAKFRTEPLAAPLRLSGVPSLDLTLNVDRSGYSHIVAQLWRIDQEGNWTHLAIGGRGLAQREGRDHDNPPSPLTPLQVPLDFEPIEAYVPAGNQLVLTIAGSNPRFMSNGNAPTITLDHASTLTLPVLPDDAPRGLPTSEYMAANPYWNA